MNTERLEALLWARIDGTIEPGELAELEAHLAEHPEPRDIERQITVMADELGNLEHEEPPAVLRERIDGALANATPPIAHQAASLLARPAPSWQARWAPLAACLVIGVAIGYLLHPGANHSIDQSEVTGTMLAPSAQVVSGPVEIHLEAGAGSVAASRSGTDIVVDVRLTSDVELAVTLAGTGGPVHLESMNSTTGSATEVMTERGWVVVRSNGPGTVTFSVIAIDAEDPLRLQVSAAGVLVDEAWIGPSRNELEP
jgi:anti-sigma factor RsiW